LAKASTNLKSKFDENTFTDWLNAYKQGVDSIKEISEASKGDRTILDALLPGLEYLEKLDKKDPKFSF